jgi:hypothetical protein
MTQLLTLMSAYDGRTIEPVDVRAWHAIASHIEYTRGQAVVMRHYSRENRRMMPADLITGAIPPREEWMHRP